MTAMPDDVRREKALDQGAFAYIDKANAYELLATIREAWRVAGSGSLSPPPMCPPAATNA